MCLYVDSEDFVYRNKIMEQQNNMEQQQYKCKTHTYTILGFNLSICLN